MGLNINIETKNDTYYNNIYIFHEDLNYNQMYTFVFNHDYKFWTFWTIKDFHNQNKQHPFKGFNTYAFKHINTCGPSYEIY